jgi:cytochrome P450
MLFLDPPRHTRIRALFNKAFTPRTLQVLRPRIEQVAKSMLDKVEHSGGSMDLIRDLAYPLPTVVIAELLGFPPEDYERLKKWSDDFAATLSFGPTTEQHASAAKSREEMRQYFERITERLRIKPEDNLISGLLGVEYEHSKLSKQELFANCVLLMAAGHETTTNLIGNSLHALTHWPGERERLVAQPALIGSAVEEFLRFESSNQLGNRISTRPTVVGDAALPADARITMCIGAANRDPAHFHDPDRLDIAREPNRHVAFGFGIHTCAGLNLARLEGRVAIGRFLARFPAYALAGPPVRGGRARFRGFLHLPVHVAAE